jgi:hypothetical protein
MSQLNKFFLTIIFIFLLVMGCAKNFERQDPMGLYFPRVHAEGLTGEQIIIPDYFKGTPILLLIGYIQDSQFDVDRWVLGLKQLDTPIGIIEIPTIQGLVPRMISSKIEQGMRDGIPEEDWGIVFTVYKDAEMIAQFLGNTKPLNARVVLIDEEGKINWFYDRGYSADKAVELDKQVRSTATQ